MNAQATYQVVSNGKVLAGHNEDDVKLAFSQKFNAELAAIQVFFCGQQKIIKKNLDKQVADKYEAALIKLGADVCVQLIAVETITSSVFDDLSLVPIGSEVETTTMSCPKCGVEQPKAIICESCGVVIKKFEEAQRYK